MKRSATDKLMTRKQVADFLGVSVRTIEGWAYTRLVDLPYVKVGKLVKYWESDVLSFLERENSAICK